MVDVIPAILTNSINEVIEKIGLCEDVVPRAQIDIIDGIFADNKTIDPTALTNLETFVGLDFHLMVKEPVNWVEKAANAGADRIIGQIEMMESQKEFIEKVQYTNLRVGLAVDIETPVSALDSLILNNVDVVLLMAVKAGWGGQNFDERVLTKIKELDEIRARDKTPFKICVDGGQTENVIDDTHFAGADEVVVGARIFNGNLKDNIEKMKIAGSTI